MVEKKLDRLGSGSQRRSSHAKDEFMSVTVRKDEAKEKIGIRLEADDKGRIRVVNIATNGMFAGSEIEVGDIVLSVNGKRLAKGEGPEALVEVIAKANTKVTVVVKKSNIEPRVPEKPERDANKIEDNNVVRVDTYYTGQSKHNEDGSLAFHTKEEVKQMQEKKEKIISCSITANKADGKGDEIDNSAGLDFVVQNKLLFVARIDKGSCFRKTKLAVGDRVLSINDCNFRSYADAAFASTIVVKAQNAVTMVLEKGVAGFTPVNRVDKEKSGSTAPSRGRTGRRSDHDSRSSREFSPSKRAGSHDDLPSKRKSKDDSRDSLTVDSDDGANSFVGDDDVLDLPPSKNSYNEVIIVAPKKFASQDVGVLFKTGKGGVVIVDQIQRNSIFEKTSLEVGDIILEINGKDYRSNPDKLDAWKMCKTTKETVSMLVGKMKFNISKDAFNLDSSVTNLEWHD